MRANPAGGTAPSRLSPHRALLSIGLSLLLAQPAFAQKDAGDDFKPYDEVITDDARTAPGLMIVHGVGDTLYYEIPDATLGRELLWVTQIAATRAGNSYAGMPVTNRVVRWERHGDDRVLLREVEYTIRARTDDPIAIAVEKTTLSPIIMSFEIAAWGKDRRPVIDVTKLFTTDVPEFNASGALRAGGMDGSRSFVQEFKSFPDNVEVKALNTYKLRAEGRAAERPRTGAVTALIHHSMVRLPDEPMAPRRWDERAGFFSVGFTDYADMDNHEAEPVRYITRWRLEKKDPAAEISDPVRPIVFYVGRAVPEFLQPYVKQGIEDWQPAFEAAGFSNAIIGRYAPDPAEDPDWDAEDARVSTIRWLPSDIKNAFGPHVHDPRTGEILEADIRMYHNVMKLVRDWYFVQASASDERAQKLPMPDELMGELVRFVVAHEVGHSIGFPHNFKASSSYTVAQLRDPEWTARNGTAPSIMDYARFNYVAQPGDGAALLPQVGPYDKFITEWGYRQFDAGADERAELEKILKRQIDEPMYRFGSSAGDPTSQTEDLADDAVEATRLGLKNLERIAGFMVDATSEQGRDYTVLANMYAELWNQWNREMGHVAAVVGGVERINLFYADADQRFFPTHPDAQRNAMRFLIDHALTTPNPAMVNDDIVLRLTPAGVAGRVASAHARLLRSLLSQSRIDRMADLALRDPDGAYRAAEMVQDLTRGVFAPSTDTFTPDLYQRNLQRQYVDALAGVLDDPAATSDRPALARHALRQIQDGIPSLKAIATAQDGPIEVIAHLEDLDARIAEALDVD